MTALVLVLLSQIQFGGDAGVSLVRRINCSGAGLNCSAEGTVGTIVAAGGGGSVPAACNSGEAITSNGSALACTATLTASLVSCAACVQSGEIESVAGSKVEGSVATATALAANPTDCSGGQFANAIDAQGNLTCATPAGGGSGVTAQVTGANYTNSTVTPSTVLSWAVTANTQYGFDCVLTATGTTTSLPRFNITGPASTNVSFRTRRHTSASAQTLLVLQAFSAAAQTAACTSACVATQLPTRIEGTFIVGASGGTVSLQAASSTAAQTVTIFRGSYCRVF